ncbi:MAG: SPL family radical SAM protein [Candidatus Omnitrophota bacterium]
MPPAVKIIPLKKVYVDSCVRDWPSTLRILERLDGVPVEEVSGWTDLEQRSSGIALEDAKKILWLTRHEGRRFKPCPATQRSYLCCGYWILQTQAHCPMDCSYCVLQGYLNRPFLTVYMNSGELYRELEDQLAVYPRKLFRAGTGELTDSLALDALTGWNFDLMSRCDRKNLIYEMKTKTAFVDHLPPAPHPRLVVSWSLNPDAMIQEFEHGAPPLARRLEGAKQAVLKGYRTGFHFDPLISIPGWEDAYGDLIDRMADAVPEEAVVWISLGTVRFSQDVRRAILDRFPATRLTDPEMIRGQDGKWRYLRPVREKLYAFVYRKIRQKWKNVFVYFCMENQDVWENVMGIRPDSNAHLDYLFHENLARRFPALELPEPDRALYDEAHQKIEESELDEARRLR